jgi:hypothetical protein
LLVVACCLKQQTTTKQQQPFILKFFRLGIASTRIGFVLNNNVCVARVSQ